MVKLGGKITLSLSICPVSIPNKTPGLAARLAIQELKPPYMGETYKDCHLSFDLLLITISCH